MMDAREERRFEVICGAANVVLHDVAGNSPCVTFTDETCEVFHGPGRKAIPKQPVNERLREYPFGWLGILTDAPPCNHELI